MKQNALTYICIVIFFVKGYGTGFDIKTSSVIDQPGVEVLGDYNSSWYLIGFEKPSRLNEPPAYQIFKYASGFPSAKTSPVYPTFGEKTVYLRSAFINNKISMFYGKCEKRAEVDALCDNREGHQQIPVILRQDYDPNTLEPVGPPQVVFNRAQEAFASSGIDIAESEDQSKTAVLIKCYYKEHAYKIILTDNLRGQVYSKTFILKQKEYLSFLKLKVGNNGEVLIETKTRNDILTLAQNSGPAEPAQYYFFSIDKSGKEVASFGLAPAVERDKYIGEPVAALLNDGEIVIAGNFFEGVKNVVAKGFWVSKYDAKFNLTGKKEIIADPKFISLAASYQESKKENGLPYLETQQVLPLEDGNFMLIGEFHRTIENHDKPGAPKVERNYIVTYRLDDKLNVNDYHFIPKKQVSASVDYAFSAQAYRKGNDVFLFHNDDWESDEEDGMNLECTRLPATGAEGETEKIIHTSGDFFTSMKHLYPASDGKLLFTEEKLVDYENESREVKLLEVTLK